MDKEHEYREKLKNAHDPEELEKMKKQREEKLKRHKDHPEINYPVRYIKKTKRSFVRSSFGLGLSLNRWSTASIAIVAVNSKLQLQSHVKDNPQMKY